METLALNARGYRFGGFARCDIRLMLGQITLLPGGRDTMTASSCRNAWRNSEVNVCPARKSRDSDNMTSTSQEQLAYTVLVPNNMPDLRRIRSVGGKHVDRDHAPD